MQLLLFALFRVHVLSCAPTLATSTSCGRKVVVFVIRILSKRQRVSRGEDKGETARTRVAYILIVIVVEVVLIVIVEVVKVLAVFHELVFESFAGEVVDRPWDDLQRS